MNAVCVRASSDETRNDRVCDAILGTEDHDITLRRATLIAGPASTRGYGRCNVGRHLTLAKSGRAAKQSDLPTRYAAGPDPLKTLRLNITGPVADETALCSGQRDDVRNDGRTPVWRLIDTRLKIVSVLA